MTTKGATAIVYPETDGMPIPDGEYQAPLLVSVVSNLDVHFRNRPNVRVNGNVFIYYVEGDPTHRAAPDCYVLLDFTNEAMESIRLHDTYLLWEVGKAPDFILEIGSESTVEEDLGRKRDLYAELAVGEYWRYDKTGGDFYGEPLVGERLVNGEYRRIDLHRESDGRVWSHSDALNLDLWWDDGELRFWDPVADRWLLSHAEERAGRLAAEAGRMEAEAGRMEAEAGRLAAETRVAELKAELRRLRGE